jgi:hypothetical protein
MVAPVGKEAILSTAKSAMSPINYIGFFVSVKICNKKCAYMTSLGSKPLMSALVASPSKIISLMSFPVAGAL